MRIQVITHAPHLSVPRTGLGTKLQQVIHKAVEAAPLPDRAKAAIKGCGGCGRRAAAINSAEAAVRKMLGIDARTQKGQQSTDA
jgi:hypothetical protein